VKEVSFKAPWGAPLAVMTVVCLVFCLGIPLVGLFIAFGNSALVGLKGLPSWVGWILAGVPLLTVLASAVFMVRGYCLGDGLLRVRRLGWETRLDLARLTSATVDPEALHKSTRLFGNGGFFCFAGWFRNGRLGVFRAFATDATRAVVLRFSDKTVVITPDDPQRFVTEIKIPHETG
jgi:hypothetical protein